EVAEVAEVDDHRARPADQRELEEQHQEARQDKPHRDRHHASPPHAGQVRALCRTRRNASGILQGMTFEAMWRDLLPIGRDSVSGGYHRSPFASAERECAAWYVEQAAARGLEVSFDGQGNAVAWWRPEGSAGKGLLI